MTKAIYIISVIFCSAVLLPQIVHADTETKKIAWIDKGKNAVKKKLKDPKSAQFRKVFFHRGSGNIPVTCGEVNAKNSFGGYKGFQRFVSGGEIKLTFLESEVDDFEKIWRQLCQ